MVNKIDGNSTYVYPRPQRVNSPDTGEKFSLGSEKDGLQAGLKDKEQVSEQERQQAAEQSGVKIELSSKGIEKQKQAKEEAAARPTAFGLTDLLDSIRTFFTSAVAAVRDIFDKIWNDPQAGDTAKGNSEMAADASFIDSPTSVEILDAAGSLEGGETTDVIRLEAVREPAGFMDAAENTAVSRIDEENADNEIRRHLQNGDVEQVIRLLTDNGRKTAARNSTLLTFYDKNGKVVTPDASVQQRTLYGDKNTLEL